VFGIWLCKAEGCYKAQAPARTSTCHDNLTFSLFRPPVTDMTTAESWDLDLKIFFWQGESHAANATI